MTLWNSLAIDNAPPFNVDGRNVADVRYTWQHFIASQYRYKFLVLKILRIVASRLRNTAESWIRQFSPLALSVFVLPFAAVLTNSSAWFFALLGRSDDLMPYSYRMAWTKI